MHMNRNIRLGVICSILLGSLAGFCVADEAPSYLVYVQGGESSITNGSDGAYVITVKDIIPYVHIADGEKSSLKLVERLTNLTYPMNAALVLSGADNETTVMVQVANVSLSDENKILTLQVDPLKYYEGERLNSFNDRKQSIKAVNGLRFTRTGVYFEVVKESPANDQGGDDGDQDGFGGPL